jgi:hypothetical protein
MIDCKDAGSKKQVRQGTCAARVSLTGRRRSAASVAAPSKNGAIRREVKNEKQPRTQTLNAVSIGSSLKVRSPLGGKNQMMTQ